MLKEINVSVPSKETILWKVDLDALKQGKTHFVVNNFIINVPDGIKLLELNDNRIVSVNPAKTYIINTKKYNKQDINLEFCACVDDTFEIPLGYGNLPYVDEERRINTTVGGNGACEMKIVSPKILYRKFNKSLIIKKDIQEYLRNDFQLVFAPVLKKFADNYGYNDIAKKYGVMSEKIGEELGRKIMYGGIELKSFKMREVIFADDYVNKINSNNDGEINDIQKVKDIVSGINGIANSNNNKSATQRLCPKCQSPVGEKDVMCSKCGTFLR